MVELAADGAPQQGRVRIEPVAPGLADRHGARPPVGEILAGGGGALEEMQVRGGSRSACRHTDL